MTLIRYSETPQVTGLEYEELRYLKNHPDEKHDFNMLAVGRAINDHVRRDKALRGIRK